MYFEPFTLYDFLHSLFNWEKLKQRGSQVEALWMNVYQILAGKQSQNSSAFSHNHLASGGNGRYTVLIGKCKHRKESILFIFTSCVARPCTEDVCVLKTTLLKKKYTQSNSK